jgi:RNA polymerase sigma-70 factor (ECF subfamily)
MSVDEREFREWYAAERAGVARALAVIGGDMDLAVEAVAEAFSRAFERWGRVGDMASRTGWVYRVALNDLRRRVRRRQREAEWHARYHAPPPAGWAAADVDVWRAVAALPERQREAVVLRYVADLRERDVAAAMGISEGAASAALTTARRTLAGLLAEVPESEAESAGEWSR